MKALVTGASGFTGSVLTEKLFKTGHDVRVLVRSRSKLKAELQNHVEVVEGDIVDYQKVAKAVKGVNKVYHIAALFRQAGVPDSVYWDVNLNGTKHVLKAALKYDIERVVHCSTVGVHGHIEYPPGNENSPLRPGDIYQVTKLEGERYAIQFHQITGLPVSVIRPGPIYGIGDMRLLKLFRLGSMKITPIIGNGEIFFNMVYVEDLANAFMLAGETNSAVGEIFIAAGPDNISLNEIVQFISKILGKPLNIFYLPAKPFQLAGKICEKICIPLNIEPPIYRRRVDFFTKSRSFDISKARKMLAYDPTTNIYEGIKKTAAWYVEQGFL